MTSIGHIGYPFRWGVTGNAAELEQDTLDEIVNCCEVITRTTIGELIDQPDFGITDPLFKKLPNLPGLSAQINNWEPRADVQITTMVDTADDLVREVALQIATRSTL